MRPPPLMPRQNVGDLGPEYHVLPQGDAVAALNVLRESAEAAAKLPVTSPLIAKLAGPDARCTWERFSVKDRRTVEASLLSVTINCRRSGPTSSIPATSTSSGRRGLYSGSIGNALRDKACRA